jgi:hypothetical protein
MSNNLSTELQDQIHAFQQERLPHIPQHILTTFQQTTEALIRSGIAERALQKGAKAPDFTLPNVRGEQVRLSDALATGPAVVTFYRGGW